ncbi:hypothetical protein BTO23_12845 [Aliivibrio sifiae]|uniref:Uncharacterized protein n=2 Tax=Aliivibrio sifiae TaxID=566293 RepID=A0A2S7X798_9GAMM|nr:hypothetical protein BTO23_12845 [Aliivibrio sifiae]GLR73857.1 hypothetical protein GCM10007855_07310 [Aliivibrio sifiae]
MGNRYLVMKRFEQRVRKTHERFGYISLEAIAGSYFIYRKKPREFVSVRRTQLAPFSRTPSNVTQLRLNQMLGALNKANEVTRLRREIN